MWAQNKPSSGIVFSEENESKGNLSFEFIFNQSFSSPFVKKQLFKRGKDLGDELSKKQHKRVEDFKVLGPVVDKSMEIMRKGFDARIQQCMSHSNIASFEFCIIPLFSMHGILRKEYALATAYIVR